MADPRTLADPDSAAVRDALIYNGGVNIFVCVIVVHDQDHLAN